MTPLLRLELRQPLPPSQDPALWRRLMRGFALTYRAAQPIFPGEAVRALRNAVFCRQHALQLEEGK